MLNFNRSEKQPRFIFNAEYLELAKILADLSFAERENKTLQKVQKKLNLEAIEDSGWVEKVKWRQKNQHWLDPSFKIAVKVLRWLRKNQITKEQLAANLGYTEDYLTLILKGNEDLKLSTITELEKATGLQLITIN